MVNDEIAKLASSYVIRRTTPVQGEFVSGFFAWEKKKMDPLGLS